MAISLIILTFHITTFSSIPPVIEKEAKTFHQMMNENGNCPACNMIESEINGPRQLFSTAILLPLFHGHLLIIVNFGYVQENILLSFRK